MGFKCRLFGHTYGNPEAERSRKEEGDEVIVTIRNVKRCERCGDEKMVNQTKEVTSVRSPEEVDLDPAEESSATAAPSGDSPPDSGVSEPVAEQGDDESPVTPVEPEPVVEPTASVEADDPVDATVGADVDPVADTAAGDDPDDGAAAGTDGDTDLDGDDGSVTDGDWDAVDEDVPTVDTVETNEDVPTVDSVETNEDSPAVDEVEESDVSTVEANEESSTAEAAAEPDDGWETGSDDWDDVDPDPDVDDAVILDAEETDRDEVQWPEESDADPEAATDADEPTVAADPTASEEAADDPTDDAEIIDAGDAGINPAGGSTTEWPDHEDTAAAGGWPEQNGADEGYSATPNGDLDAEFEGDGLTPEVNGGAPDDPSQVDGITAGGAEGAAAEWARASAEGDAVDESDSGTGQGFVRAGESASDSEVPSDRVEFYCPNCGYAQTAGRSSLRAGDICPECKQGYIAERER